jgi:RNA polymerase sigma factor (sigma-70 family)
MTLASDAPVELLTAQDERRLSRAIEAGVLAEHLLTTGERPVPATDAELEELAADGHRCWQHFLLANLRLVWKLAGAQARRSGLPGDDLFQEGFVALAGALQRFDPGRGRFSTYATRRIEQHLAVVVSSRLGELALPKSRAVQLRRARALAMTLTQENGRTVSVAELAAGLDQTPEWTRRLVAHRAPLSLDAVAGVLVDRGQPDPEERVFREQVRQMLDRLPADQAELVRFRFGLAGEPLSLVAAAQRQRVSLSSAKRLERAALAALRSMIEGPCVAEPSP